MVMPCVGHIVCSIQLNKEGDECKCAGLWGFDGDNVDQLFLVNNIKYVSCVDTKISPLEKT